MKKILTLATMGLLSAASFSAQAQTLDGQLLPAEGYTMIGENTSTVHGFGDHGIGAMYVKTTATKLYIALTAALETNGNSLQIYLNLPGKTGIAAGQALAASNTTGTSFEKNMAKMDMEVDYAFGVKGGTTSSAGSIIDYTKLTDGKATDQKTGDLLNVGTAATVADGTTGGFGKTRMAFTNLNTLTAHTAAGGTAAWEIELDKADLGIADNDVIQLFAAQNNGDGGYFSSDVLPVVPGNTAPQTAPIGTNNEGNFATNPDFSALPGTQSISYTVMVATANRGAVARELDFQVYPNPAHKANIRYKVTGQNDVVLEVYNLMGQRMRTLAAAKQSGTQSVALTDLKAGTYLVKLRVGDQLTSQKVVIL
ncbi:T9SS type A sorting domain-containing protein [Hymenobacter sp. J193]|uniref:T9SS type A sorting domain-containing protein n=1 Tax=Hymenobacter sp. J193 TaxID=2898429 RepID=UPI002150FD7E|nr:T9SS type A sorting domain-containing protein [Hymenobacter sp. J193]MCR5889560.1 T9SS type A sorting domain-containing protein [Hymenobacter sp. J193]